MRKDEPKIQTCGELVECVYDMKGTDWFSPTCDLELLEETLHFLTLAVRARRQSNSRYLHCPQGSVTELMLKDECHRWFLAARRVAAVEANRQRGLSVKSADE